MTTRDEPWPQGTPCWLDGMLDDAQAARGFYAELFGWEMADTGPETGDYTICRLAGRPVAGLGQNPPGARMPPVWTVYLAVDDVDAVAGRVTGAGGQIFMQPMEVLTQGRMAIAADPAGAVFGLWQAADHPGAGIVAEPGAMAWNECMSRDYARAKNFYADVFGYELEEIGDDTFRYCVLHLDGRAVGGVGEVGADMPADVPSHWMSYFAVDDADVTVERAGRLGATVRMPPTDTPYGRVAVLAGAQGEGFAVIAGRGGALRPAPV